LKAEQRNATPKAGTRRAAARDHQSIFEQAAGTHEPASICAGFGGHEETCALAVRIDFRQRGQPNRPRGSHAGPARWIASD